MQGRDLKTSTHQLAVNWVFSVASSSLCRRRSTMCVALRCLAALQCGFWGLDSEPSLPATWANDFWYQKGRDGCPRSPAHYLKVGLASRRGRRPARLYCCHNCTLDILGQKIISTMHQRHMPKWRIKEFGWAFGRRHGWLCLLRLRMPTRQGIAGKLHDAENSPEGCGSYYMQPLVTYRSTS